MYDALHRGYLGTGLRDSTTPRADTTDDVNDATEAPTGFFSRSVHALGQSLRSFRTESRTNVEKTARPISHLQDTSVCFWVFDEGPGIQRKDWGKVFTPFETLHSGILTAEGQGSGLGLAISATVIRMHDGCVGFSSLDGVGSIFFLWTRMQVDAGVCT